MAEKQEENKQQQQHQNAKSSENKQITDQEQPSTKKPKIQIPISWKEELYMVREKVIEELMYVVEECIEIDKTGDEAERLELMQIKKHFQKRLKGFYNTVITTFRDNVEYVAFDDSVQRKKQQVLYTQKDLTLEGNNQESLGQFRELLSRTDGLKQKIQLDIQDQLQKDVLQKKELANQQDKSNNNLNQNNTFEKLKVKDDKGNEKSLNLPGFIKEAIEKQAETMKKEVNRIKEMHPHLTDRLKEFHLHTRGHIKKTIELQYALENIKQSQIAAKQQGKSNIFAVPSIPSSLFE